MIIELPPVRNITLDHAILLAMSSDRDDFKGMLLALTDDQLVFTAGDYIWLAEFGPMQGRSMFYLKRDLVVAECGRRRREDIVASARNRFAGRQ